MSLQFTLMFIFSESAHWADSVSKSRCLSVCLCVYVSVPLFAVLLNILLFPSNQPIAKRFFSEKLRKGIGLRFSILCSEMVENRCTEKRVFLVVSNNLYERTT